MQIFLIVIFTANIFILNANPTQSKNKKYIVEVGNSPAKDKMEETAKKVAVPDDDGVDAVPVDEEVAAVSDDDGVDTVPLDDGADAVSVDDGLELAAVPNDGLVSVPVKDVNAGGNDYGGDKSCKRGCGCYCSCEG